MCHFFTFIFAVFLLNAKDIYTVCHDYLKPLPSQRDVIVNLTSVLLIRQSDSGAPVCARLSRWKADTLNTVL